MNDKQDVVFGVAMDPHSPEYQRLLEIAKREGKSVNEVISQYIGQGIEKNSNLHENHQQKKVLFS